MSFSRTVTYETGSNGDAITTTNTSSDTLRQTTSAGTGTISTIQVHGGTRSLHMTGTTTSGLWCVEDAIGALATWTDDFYLYVAALPSAEISLRRLTDTSSAVCKLGLNNAGALVMRDSTGTNIYASASGKRITVGNWVHIVWETTAGASGTQRVRWYPAGSGTATDDSTIVASNNGTGNFSIHRRGVKCETSTATSDLYFDDETMSGTSAANPPTAAFTSSTSSYTVSLDASTSSAVSPATVASYAWDFGDTNSGSGVTTSHTYATPGTYTVNLAITDSNSQTNSVSRSVTISVGTYNIFHRNGMEGQTNGAAATVSNSSTSGNPWTLASVGGGSAIYTSARAASGSLSLQITTDGSSSAFFDDSSFNSTSMAVSDCFYYPALPSSTSAPIYSLRTAAGVSAALWITTAGKLQVLDAANGAAITSANTLVPGHWYRIELQVFSDATNGTIALQYYIDNSGSAVEALSSTGSNTRGGNMTYIRRGCSAPTYTSSLPYWNFDNIQTWDGTTTPIGIYTNNIPPKALFSNSASQATVSYNGTGSSAFSPATLSTYAWNYGDGNTGSGSTVSHTYTTSGTYVTSLTVTDSNGLHNTMSQSVMATIPSVLPVMYVYHGGAWVGSQLYLYHGGQWAAGE